MRIIEQVQAAVIGLTDMFVVDGSIGTRAISFENLLKAINQKIGWMYLWGDNIPVEVRRNTWRGKNLGSVVTQQQWDEIGAGTFKNMFLGDYWEIDGRIWRIVDFDYWLGDGYEGEVTKHHLVIMPDKHLYKAAMNNTNTTVGGYVGSKMYTENLAQAKTLVNGAFGASHVLSHKEYLINAVTNGNPTAGAWFDSTVELPNELMMYGCRNQSSVGSGINSVTNSFKQLAGLEKSTQLTQPQQVEDDPYLSYWLRDVKSSEGFAVISSYGASYVEGSSQNLGVRPVFGIRNDV